MSTRHRTTGRVYLATCGDGCPLMLWAEEAVTNDTQARRAIADATGIGLQGFHVQLLDRPAARRHYRGINQTLLRQGCTHRPVRTRQ